MFLSKFELDWNIARDTNAIHKYLWQAFQITPVGAVTSIGDWFEASDSINKIERDFLFRVEWANGKPGKTVPILVQSQRQPQKLNGGSCRLLACKPYNPAFRMGDILQFALCAHPTIYHKYDNKAQEQASKQNLKSQKNIDQNKQSKEGYVAYLSKEEDQLEWVKRKFAECAEIIEVQVNERKKHYIKRSTGSITLEITTFSGLMKVKNAAELIRLIEKGIGKRKVYGCGLVSLAKVKR
jgi:CRISPR system Cascade subunit CasE